ncbi:MAG: MmgE/PrpD family protein [Chloroflexi bacterium]|nr:MmgE/PrpD family protein [Chloroflexota bacterium]
MGQQIERLARLVAETPTEAIPPEVREHAKLVVLDTLGVLLAGSEQPEVARLRDRLVASGGAGATVLARGCPRADLRTAALLNAIAARSIEMSEAHRFVSCQGGAQILPAVLADGETTGASGSEALAALVVGYEAAVRIGAAAKGRRLVHQNGTWPLLGAVAAGARVRGLSAAQTSRALRIGATLVLVPSYTNAVAGATALNVAGGMSSFAGTLAPDLALAGFEAQPDAIEEAFRELVGDGFDATRVDEGLGEQWRMVQTQFRVRACCTPIFAALDALEEVLAELRPRPDDIERIEAEVWRFAAAMSERDPRNAFAAHYSFPHAAAATVVRGHAGYNAFTEEALHDPAIVALRQRVSIREEPAFTAQAPRLKPGRVTVVLRDGRRATRTVESARGDHQRPFARADLLAKFRELAGMVLQPQGVGAVEELVGRLDRLPDVRELVEAVRAHSR